MPSRSMLRVESKLMIKLTGVVIVVCFHTAFASELTAGYEVSRQSACLMRERYPTAARPLVLG